MQELRCQELTGVHSRPDILKLYYEERGERGYPDESPVKNDVATRTAVKGPLVGVNDLDSGYANGLEFSGGIVENRTRMTGLEDRGALA